ncbi:MAG: hypothetical protein FWG36_07135 [Oscillospiraceae bacterium]|nr:hypothetical protein [Oscillospiraceae bacterium]
MKRFICCFISLLFITLPIIEVQAKAAVTSDDRVSVSQTIISRFVAGQTSLNVIFNIGKRASVANIDEVYVAVVPAGAEKPTATDSSMKMMEGEGTFWKCLFDTDILYGIGDFNLWFFVDGLSPMTDNKCWRASNRTGYFDSFRGLDPIRPYASVNAGYFGSTFTLTAHSVIEGSTKIELVKRGDETNIVYTIAINAAGTTTHSIPNLNGGYILRYTKGDKSQDLAYLRILGGKLPFGLTYGTPRKAEVLPYSSEGAIIGWSKGEDKVSGMLVAIVSVANEDFDHNVELYLVDKDSADSTSIGKTAENGTLTSIATVDTGILGGWNPQGPVRYFINVTIDSKPDDGTYLLQVRRGSETVDIYQFEMFNGVLYDMLPGEMPIKPLSVNDPDLLNEYYRIFIYGETVEAATATSYFSIDGGKKWKPISELSNYAKRDKNGQQGYNKVFNKGFELWLSDKSPVKKDMPEDAKIIKFPQVGKRQKTAKLEVNYQLAHMVNGVLAFEFGDENLWLPVEKGSSEPLRGGYIYRYGGTREDNQGYTKQTGKPDYFDRYYNLGTEGIPIPESDEDNGGVKFSESEYSERISYRSIKENYFVSAVPYIDGGTYYPASKPAKLAVSSYIKPKAMKADYKKETLKLVAGAVFEDPRFYNGIVSVETAKNKSEAIISITSMLDDDCLEASYQIVPMGKKPASCPVYWELAYRGTGMMELYSEMERDREINITEYGKFRPSKALQFRLKGDEKWGGFKAPKSGGVEYEFRSKATAKSGKMMFEGDEWYIFDSIVFKRDDEWEVWAAGKVLPFEYGWGTAYETKNGKTPGKEGIEWTNIG